MRGLRQHLAVAVQVALAALALRLFVPAAMLAFAPAAAREFEQSGLPGWLRPLLAFPELVGAVLLVVRCTFWIGVGLLAFALAGAIGAHLYLHRPAGPLFVFLGLLGLLAAARQTLRPPSPP